MYDLNLEDKFRSVLPIMKGLFKGYQQLPMNSMKPSIIYDEKSYLINFMILSNSHKFNKLLLSDEILNVEVGVRTNEELKLEVIMVFNKQFKFSCLFHEKDQAGRRTVYEAFELSKQLVIWDLDGQYQLVRVQKINFDFMRHLNAFNKYLLQV